MSVSARVLKRARLVVRVAGEIPQEASRLRDVCSFSPRASRTASAFVVLGVLLGTSGCVDTRQKLEDFQERYERTHEGGAGDGGVCPPGFPEARALAGDYLLAVSPAFSAKTPIVFIAAVTAESAAPDQLRFSFDLTPLSAADRRTPVGGSIGRAETTSPAGAFTLDYGQITVPGEADPIIPGAPIVATVTLTGQLCGPDPTTESVSFLCGDVNGTVTQPTNLNLAGSTWTARRITDPSTLPEITINCAQEAPNPL
jgi:hypothetical protein